MKKKIASLVAIALVAVAISIGITVYASVYSPTPEPDVTSSSIRGEIGGFHGTPKEYVLNTTLPSVPDKLMVYRTKPNITREEVTSLAERLGMNGSVREADWMFLVTDGQYDLDVSKISGAMVYTDTSRSMTGNDKDKPENLPSDDEAIEIARKFLEERGLMPEDAVFRRVEHRVLKAIKGGKTIGIGWEAIEVRFGRRINGIPVDGAGITVGVGGYGDVIELWKKWREYEPYKEYPIITPEEAFEEMKREGVDVSLRNVSTATVNNVYLAYYSKCALDEQTYLKPVYVFEGDAEGKSAECNETGIVQYRNETAHFKQFIVAAPELGGLYAEQ